MQVLNFDCATLPRFQNVSTARKGDEWRRRVRVGDVVTVSTATHEFGRAVITGAHGASLAEVIAGADWNHLAISEGASDARAQSLVRGALTAAYGKLHDDDQFTVLHFLVLNEAP